MEDHIHIGTYILLRVYVSLYESNGVNVALFENLVLQFMYKILH